MPLSKKHRNKTKEEKKMMIDVDDENSERIILESANDPVVVHRAETSG